MTYRPANPLIVQSDQTLLLETASPRYVEARDALLVFAELVKRPEHVHTWRLTPLSLWNAAAAGYSAAAIISTLEGLTRYPIPENVPISITTVMARYGAVRLLRDGARLHLQADDPLLLQELRQLRGVGELLGEAVDARTVLVHPRQRGELKQVMLAAGHPIADLAGYDDGDTLTMKLTDASPGGEPWELRGYQVDAVDAFYSGPGSGSGVIVLPCGAGKTLVGIAAMVRLGMRTLILCTGHTALQQWRRELLRRTTLTADDIGEYTAAVKQLRPVTLTTYQLLTWRRDRHAAPAHFGLFHQARWGLVIYDEVHLLPAPVFREAAHLQARRRLGLTATLVREDDREGDVFALIGPKRFDMPWRELERQGWIAAARCVEVQVPLSEADRLRYVRAGSRAKFLIASKNARKGAVLEMLLARHAGASVLVLGTHLDQLEWIARRLQLPLVTGKTPAAKRDVLFARFRAGELPVLALSKVGNFAIDLPGASVAIQIAGTWGSRQEEAQRLGRVLRPKAGSNQATFYTLVSARTREQELAEHRQLFLAEQGYPYRIEQVA